jgi:uncharacterized membrane protein
LLLIVTGTLFLNQEGFAWVTVVAMTVMVLIAIATGMIARKQDMPKTVFPVLIAAGLVVAGYLSYIEVGEKEPVCGGVGECSLVQQSEYADLLGVPIGVLGIIVYVSLLIMWLLSQNTDPFIAHAGRLGLLVLTLSGVLFSAYLTFLEPFVIGASCAWCLSSALIMNLLLWLSFSQNWRELLPRHPQPKHRTLKRI